jgi:very-short-patch-repair endonuclease
MYRDSEQREFARRLRNTVTPAERHLWRLLRANQLLGFRFRRQAAIGAYVVDFVCFSKKVVVELDGPQHLEEQALTHDTIRTQWLVSRGFRVLRFRNHELDDDAQSVIDVIRKALEVEVPTAAHPLSPTLSAEERGPEES